MPALFNISRKTGSSLIVAMLAVLVSGTSCSEDSLVNDLQGKDRMSFDVSVSDKWDIVKTRSTGQGKTITSKKMENSDLWLITTVENNCDTTLFDAPKGQTRATPYAPTDDEGNNDSRLQDFGVYAWTYTGDDWDNATNKKLYIGGDKVTRSGEVWAFNPSRFWPGDAYRMKFFAYAPHSFANGNEMSIVENGGKPVITYTTALDARDQQDLLATTELTDAVGDYNQTLPLKHFRHLLTAVNVKASDNLGRTITSIKFSGIKQSGTYTLGDIEWDPTGNDIEISCTGLEKPLGETVTEIITDDEGTTFMMIPQSLENAKIEVTLKNAKGNEETLSASLLGEWKMGERVVYTLSLTDEIIEGIIEFRYDEIAFDYKGENTYAPNGGTLQTYARRSHYVSYVKKTDSQGKETIEPKGWTARFVERQEDGNSVIPTTRPEWVKGNISTNGVGNIPQYDENNQQTWNNDYSFSMTLEKAKLVPNLHNNLFKGKTPVKDYDLSTKGGTTEMNTANCYIVNAPGTYKFPLVYGNAIQNGNDNIMTYRAVGIGEGQDILLAFLNHANKPIENAWIASSGNKNEDDDAIVPYDAVLIWEDTQNSLVTNVRLTPDPGTTPVPNAEDYRVNFEITDENIKQGNAVIAVRDANQIILWSWHIWVTDYEAMSGPEVMTEYKPSDTQVDRTVYNRDNENFIFMGVPLGWCDGDSYEGRETWLELTQDDTGEKAYLKIVQKEAHLIGNAPYYQWGRKDPMLPFSGDVDDANNRNKKYRNHNGYILGNKGNQTSIGEAIQNPHLFIDYAQSLLQNWFIPAGNYLNLWDMRYTGNNVYTGMKTVYDPSPVGYMIPPVAAYSGIIYEGTDTGFDSMSKINTPYTSKSDASENHGWMFYCKKMTALGVYEEEGGLIYIPALGQREYYQGNKTISKIGTIGATYWSAEAVPGYLSDNLKINTGDGVHYTSSDVSGHGMPVRPIRQQ